VIDDLEDRLAEGFAQVEGRLEAREREAERFDPLAVRETSQGVVVGDIAISLGRGALALSDDQVEALTEWCTANDRPNLLSNVRRARDAHRREDERTTREHEELIASNQQRAVAAAAVRDVERFEEARDRAELAVGRLVAEGADESELHAAEDRLALAERQVVYPPSAWGRSQSLTSPQPRSGPDLASKALRLGRRHGDVDARPERGLAALIAEALHLGAGIRAPGIPADDVQPVARPATAPLLTEVGVEWAMVGLADGPVPRCGERG
jgi:hypothetical protein